MTKFWTHSHVCSGTLVVIGLFLFSTIARAQLVAEITADKATYEYGESIVVTLKLYNPTSEIVQFEHSCPPKFYVGDFQIPIICFAGVRHYYGPGSWRTWEFEMKPSEYGLPTYSGQHSVSVSYHVYADTLEVEAPKYFGGRIFIQFTSGTAANDVDAIRQSLNGVVINSNIRINGILSKTWEISGTTIEDAITLYQGHLSVVSISHSVQPAQYFSVDVESPSSEPHDSRLTQNYPNPFNPSTTISYSLPHPGDVRLEVFDLLGKRVRLIDSGYKTRGEHEVPFDASDLSSGLYFYTLTTGNFTQTRKMILLR